ncbi:MAG TPA: hypothetical protein VGD79_03350 [Thermoanaerobaculia bacterium]|jgi:hypothetical protein
MKPNAVLTVSSLLSLLLLSIHITDDIVRGFDKWGRGSAFFAVLILPIFLYGTLVLGERRSGLVIMILGGIFAAGMPVIHRGAGAVAKSSGGFFFLWTLFALGATGTLSIVLAARALRLSAKKTIMTAVAHENPDRRG